MQQFVYMYLPPSMSVEEISRQPYACMEYAESLSGLPPIIGAVGGLDILHDQGVSFFQKVQAAGGEVAWCDVARARHSVLLVFDGILGALLDLAHAGAGRETIQYVMNKLQHVLYDM